MKRPSKQRIGIGLSFPAFEFFGWQRLEERWSHFEFAVKQSRRACFCRHFDRNEADDWVFTASDDDVFAALGPCDKPGQVGFGFVDCCDPHISDCTKRRVSLNFCRTTICCGTVEENTSCGIHGALLCFKTRLGW